MNWSDKITVTNEDNMQLMARYPDKYFDLAIVDPPYGINVEKQSKFGNKKDDKIWDNHYPNEKYFSELFRVSKNQIIFTIYSKNHEYTSKLYLRTMGCRCR